MNMKKSTKTSIRLLAAVATIALVPLFGTVACSAEGSIDDDGGDYHHLAVGQVLTRQPGYEIFRDFAGLVASRQVSSLAFEQAGELAHILVDEGDRVVAGQLLAELDTRLLQAQRDDLAARRQEIEAQLTLNQLNRQRVENLRGKGFAADQQIDELEAERKSLNAQMSQIAAELAANTTRLDQSVLVAPFDGAISQRLADTGVVVAAGKPLLTVLESRGMEARVGVPVRLLGDLSVGDPVEIRVAGRPVEGRIIALGNDVTRATLTVPIRVALPNDGLWLDGDQAYLRLPELVSESGYWVPMAALTDGMRGLWNVYVMDPLPATQAGKSLYVLKSRDVRVLWADQEKAFINGALATGEWVVAGGLQRLVPGQQVRRSATADRATNKG
jgi:RND family efflux transporter MFP subunit